MSRARAGRKRRSSKRAGRDNAAAMIAITLIVCFLFAVLFFQGMSMDREIDANEARRVELEEAIASEEARTESIESLREYMQSEEYIRQAAKDRLGLVESGEVVFKMQEQNGY